MVEDFEVRKEGRLVFKDLGEQFALVQILSLHLLEKYLQLTFIDGMVHWR